MASEYYGHHIDADGFEAAYKDSATFGPILWHRHAGVSKGGTASVSNVWHWASDVHLGHGSSAARKAILAGRLVDPTPRNASGKLIPAINLADVRAAAEMGDTLALSDPRIATELAFEAAGYSR